MVKIKLTKAELVCRDMFYYALKKRIPEIENCLVRPDSEIWWELQGGIFVGKACMQASNKNNLHKVVPAVFYDSSQFLPDGTVLKVRDLEFVVVSECWAVCTSSIGEMQYGEEAKNYFGSELEATVNDWFKFYIQDQEVKVKK